MILVDYNTKSGRFVIKSPFWALGLMRGIPNRRWEKKLGAWTAPALRANVDYLKTALPSNTTFSNEARIKFADIEGGSKCKSLPWPETYKFHVEPYPHQMLALNAMYGMNSFALFMDMRTGKTKVIIDWARAMHEASRLERAVIIPLRTLRKNWGREFSIQAPAESYELLYLDTDKRVEFDRFNGEDNGKLKVLMVGIESLSAGRASSMVLEFLRGDRSAVIIDESDTIKSHNSIRTQKTFEFRNKAEFRIIMTGTPIDSGPMDMFSQFEFIDPNIIGIGDYYSFRNRYAIMGGYENKEIIGYQNMQELTELVKPYVYQIRYTDVFKSPPKIEMVRTCQMTPEQTKIYRRIKKDGTIRVNGDDINLIVQNVLEKMLRMQEVAGGFWAERVVIDKDKEEYKYKHHPIHPTVTQNPKIAELIKLLSEPEFAQEQGIIWSIHRAEIAAIMEAISDMGKVVEFHGGVTEDQRAEIDEAFRRGEIKWIVANPTTGGRGYTFDRAGFMVNYSSNFRFITRVQSLERATASHKTKPVMVVDLVCEDTVDEVVLESHNSKMDVAEFVRNAISGRKRGVDELLVG